MAQKLRQGKNYLKNAAYLNPEIFTRQFYEPANDILGANLQGFIFEQEYHRKQDRLPVEQLADELDRFFQVNPHRPTLSSGNQDAGLFGGAGI